MGLTDITDCVYDIMSYLPNTLIWNIDNRCRNIAIERYALKIQRAVKQWAYNTESAKKDPRMYLKQYLPLSFRKQVAMEMKEYIIASMTTVMMERFDEMTYKDSTIYTNMRINYERIAECCVLYSDLQSKVLDKIRQEKLCGDNDTLIIECLVNDLTCEWVIQFGTHEYLSMYIDMIPDQEVFEYYIDLLM